MTRISLLSVPLFAAARVTAASFTGTNAIFHALGRYARAKGMTADEVAVEWHLSLAVAKDMLEGRDFAEMRTKQ